MMENLLNQIPIRVQPEVVEAITKAGSEVSKTVIEASGFDFGDLFTALFGTLVGALAAYGFERLREAKAETDRQHQIITGVQLKLAYHQNSLESMNRHWLEHFRKDPDRTGKLSFGHQSQNHFQVEAEALSFLVGKVDGQLFREIYLANQTYQNVFAALRVRNETLKRIRENSKFIEVDESRDQAVLEGVSELDALELNDATDNLYLNVDDGILRLSRAQAALLKEVTPLYPKHTFLRITVAAPGAPPFDPSLSRPT